MEDKQKQDYLKLGFKISSMLILNLTSSIFGEFLLNFFKNQRSKKFKVSKIISKCQFDYQIEYLAKLT